MNVYLFSSPPPPPNILLGVYFKNLCHPLLPPPPFYLLLLHVQCMYSACTYTWPCLTAWLLQHLPAPNSLTWLEGPPCDSSPAALYSQLPERTDLPPPHLLTHPLYFTLTSHPHHALDYFLKYSPQGTPLPSRGLPFLLWTPQRP